MNFSVHRFLVAATCLLFGGSCAKLSAAWRDRSAGSPLIQTLLAKDLGQDLTKWTVIEDRLGRVFVGGKQLQVFDGQAWRSFPVEGSYALRSLSFGEKDRLWAGAYNQVGYFDEPSPGEFRYHSLVSFLPEKERAFGDVWDCAQIGHAVYFLCQDKLLRWADGRFSVTQYPGKNRIFPLKVGNEHWFHHLESGLHQLTEDGEELVVSSSSLPPSGIIGLARDSIGLWVASTAGVFRPGNPPQQMFDPKLSEYLQQNRLASFAVLPNGNLAFGTVNGGLLLASVSGEVLRVLGVNEGLPSRAVFSIIPDSEGFAWCATPKGIFRFEYEGKATVFGPRNGLASSGVLELESSDSAVYALTLDGVFQLNSSDQKAARFEQLPLLVQTYINLLSTRHGLLLGRFGGADFFDGKDLKQVYAEPRATVFAAQEIAGNPSGYYLAERSALARLTFEPDGSFGHSLLTVLPDTAGFFIQDSSRRLWMGTPSKGALVYDPAANRLEAVRDPATGSPLTGATTISGNAGGILVTSEQPMIRARADGGDLQRVEGAPSLKVIDVREVPNQPESLFVFSRPGQASVNSQGVGVVRLDSVGGATWRELKIAGLEAVGFVHTLEFTQENGRAILWLGGTEGVLRLDYAALQEFQPPLAPTIVPEYNRSISVQNGAGLSFPEENQRIRFNLFAGSYTDNRSLAFQVRLGEGKGEWSAPATGRSVEFSHLSDGNYRFEARAVNEAGMSGASSFFDFRVLPPWYQSGWAYAGYAVSLSLATLALMRLRERAIRIRNRQLEEMIAVRTADLVRANAAKDEFLSNVGHEIRNPMNGVIGIAETLDTEQLDGESRKKFGVLRQCAGHLSALLEDILDFSRIQAGAIELEPKAFDLAALTDSIAAIHAAEIEKLGMSFEIAIAPDVPNFLVGDARRIRQILLNLVGNAIKFSGQGEVCLTIWRGRKGTTEKPEVVFAVSDDGPGIAEEEQKKLFVRFERGAAAQSGRIPGTGLGLALSRALAEKMHGRMWLESEPGKGACFFFSATLAEAAEAVRAETPPPRRAGERPGFALVVDDQEYNRIALTSMLEAFDFIVFSAADGTQALEVAAREALDFVFLDYNLPGLNGAEVARGLRGVAGRSATATIFATTSFISPEIRQECLRAGMTAFLNKPVTMERLRHALAAVSTPRGRHRPGSASPADPLGNLRLLADKKQIPFADELLIFLAELDRERANLVGAIQREEPRAAGHYSHLLYGRCAFICETELENTLRKIEAAAVTGKWDEARSYDRLVTEHLSSLRLRLSSIAAGDQSA